MPTTETITREDIALFINACCVATAQTEFYSSALEQRVSLEFLHEYICGNYRELYAHALNAGINHFNMQEIVFRLLSSGKHCPDGLRPSENELIRLGLQKLPPQRVWKLFERLRKAGVNNRRTRATIRTFIANRKDLAFDAVKYRHKLRSSLMHAHINLEKIHSSNTVPMREKGELERFLFEPIKISKKGGNKDYAAFKTPLLEQFRSAHYSQEALYHLPYSIAEVFAAKHGIPREQFLAKIAPRMTEREKLRLQEKSGGKLELNPTRLSLTELCVYLLSMPLEERFGRRLEIEGWLEKSCGMIKTFPTLTGKIACVLDNSYSSSGSSQKKNRPLALAWAVHVLITQTTRQSLPYRAFWTSTIVDDLLVHARGQSCITERFLDALEWGATTVIIVSDGVENDPARAFEAILAGYRRIAESMGGQANVIHLNPIFDAELLEVRRLAPELPALGLRDGENLAFTLEFARFCGGMGTLEELCAWLGKG
jgi:hypothetical protein